MGGWQAGIMILALGLSGSAGRVAAADDVVATVRGEPITQADLKQTREALAQGGSTLGGRDLDRAALERVIVQRVLADAARRDGIDRTPEYKAQVAHAVEGILLQLYRRHIAERVVAPNGPEAEAYVAAHPQMFSARRILVLNQIVVEGSAASPGRFASVHSLSELRTLLEHDQTAYRESTSIVDTLATDPAIVKQIDDVNGHDILVNPANGGLVFSELNSARPAPFVGAPASAFATQRLKAEQAQHLMRKAAETEFKAASTTIKFRPGYEPLPAKSAP